MPLWLAGCGAAPAPESVGSSAAGPPQVEFDEETGALEGLVLDEALASLEGADVMLEAPGRETVTDAEGRFSFSYLRPGPYQVTAAKLGYQAATQTVVVTSGQATSLQLQLYALPNPLTPYVRVHSPIDGLIACSVGWMSWQTADACKDANPQAHSVHRIEPDSLVPITGAVYELVWMRSSAMGAQSLSLYYPVPIENTGTITTNARMLPGGLVRGPSPIEFRIEAIDPNLPINYYASGSQVKFEVRAAGSTTEDTLHDPMNDGSSKLVLDQRYTLYVTYFYNGAPIPEDYAARPQ